MAFLNLRPGSARIRTPIRSPFVCGRARAKTAALPVAVFDPSGRTTKMLAALGYRTVPWNGRATAQLVVIGREALSSGAKTPGDLAAFVRGGGRLLVMQQKPEWMERMWGFRVSRHVSRRVFPVDAAHPVVNGLDVRDLRDWAGSSNGRGPQHRSPAKTKRRPTAGTGAIAAAWPRRPWKSRTWRAGARFCRASSIWPTRRSWNSIWARAA
jgi:hypothetical protein